MQLLQHIAYNLSCCCSLHRKRSDLAGSISLGNLKQKCEQHSLIISLLEVRKSFMRRRVTLFSGQTSKQYSSMGRHLVFTRCRKTSSDADLPSLPNNAFIIIYYILMLLLPLSQNLDLPRNGCRTKFEKKVT